MHGRDITILATLLAMAFAAAPAAADQTLGLGQPADGDGVVTSWTATASAPQTVRLRSVQPLLAGPALVTATSDPVAIGPTAATTAARLPIAAGGELALVDASGTPTVSAVVEPDADGDGYGDTTQDACPGDFTAHTSPCPGTATIGSPLTLAPDPRGFSAGAQALQGTAPGTAPATPIDGILTHVRVRQDTAGGATVVQVLRPAPDGMSYTVVGAAAPVTAADEAVHAVGLALAVKAGDVLAAAPSSGTLGAVAHRAGDALVTRTPPVLGTGATVAPNGTAADLRLLVQADVETDADGDGRGDATQDAANLVVTGRAPAEVGPLDGFTQTYTIRNSGPDAALRLAVTLHRSGGLPPRSVPPGMTCAAGGGDTVTCTLARLAPGAAFTLEPDGAGPSAGGTTTSDATASALTPDPDPTNNSASLSTHRRPLTAPAPPAPPAKVVPCANVIKGTRDDDVLRGTVFGDRLVGGDGRDLLKGGAGDDCLEGGTGNDVLDGGDGNDRLNGASGKDRLSGGNGDDRLTGGRGNDVITGGPGKDTISPGDGKDSVNAGAGNDTINAVDGVAEHVDCGAGRDTVRADRRDRLVHCEKVTRKR
ncbi:MAG TPA: hypothetical protein VI318_06045 [Baekduia sp.]